MDKRIVPLTMGGLAIGTTEFTIMGLLPDIARSLHVSIPQAGLLISAYALGVVIGAPIFILYTVRFSPKKVLAWLMVMFTVFNGLSIIAPGFNLMLASRFLSGLPHGAFFGVGAVVASRLAGKGREAKYIALMFTGLTVANLVMVPLVTYIGHTFHWRWYFAIVTFIGVLTIASVYRWLPPVEGKENADIRTELALVKNRQVWYILLVTAIGFGGLFAWFSYISPLMTEVAGVPESRMAYVMVLAGAGMVAGNLLGGYLSDRMGASKTTVLLMSLMMMSLLGVFFFGHITVVALVLTFVCGALSMSVSSPVNIMMMSAAPGGEMMGAAFIQAAFNIANSAGAYLGAIPLVYGLSFNYPSLVGAGMTVTGLLICIRYRLKYDTAKKPVSALAAGGGH